jgi:heme-degrading monooxygenase HmoA
MPPKTSVDGNRVTIDGFRYDLSPAGKNRYALADEFGAKLGYFAVNGRVVTPEDFGVEGAHPVMQIGKVWLAAQAAKAPAATGPVQTKGYCRVVTHEKPSDADVEKARAHRAWLKKQPGCKASYFVHDPASGKAMSISIWESRDHLAAVKDADAPEGAAALASAAVEVFPMVEEP